MATSLQDATTASTPTLTSTVLRRLLSSTSVVEELEALRAFNGLTIDERSTASDEWQQLVLYAIVRGFGGDNDPRVVFDETISSIVESIGVLGAVPQGDASIQANAFSAVTRSIHELQCIVDLVPHITEPRVRQGVLHLSMTSLLSLLQASNALTPGEFVTATDLIVVGVTDLWSAIRKDSARLLVDIAASFPSLEHVNALLDRFLGIVSTTAASWQAQEGALLALDATLSAIRMENGASVKSSSKAAEPAVAEMIRGPFQPDTAVAPCVYHIGRRHRGLTQIPRPLASRLKPTLYTALKHDQLSIRELAAGCLARYMGICDDSTRVLTFQEVLSKLNRLHEDDGGNGDEGELLDAAEAEGLLDVLARLAPYLPAQFLLKHWKLVFPTLERYVTHIASSVRLKSSAVVLAFARLSQRAPHDWGPRAVALGERREAELLLEIMFMLADEGQRESASTCCWQRLEGRLLSIDVLVSLLGVDHLWRGHRLQAGPVLLLHVPSQPFRRMAHHHDERHWLPQHLIPQSTWTVDEDEEARLRALPMASVSVLAEINERQRAKSLASTSDDDETPGGVSSSVWAARVLGSWLRQTRVAFESPQFELRRISRQVLPGLVRLCLWCDQLPLLGAEQRVASAAGPSHCPRPSLWSATALRFLVLHLQLLTERLETTAATTVEAVEAMIQRSRGFVLSALESVAATGDEDDDSELIVARTELWAMAALLCHGHRAGAGMIAAALDTVHAHLPVEHQRLGVPGSKRRSRGPPQPSVDRQLAIGVVLLLPRLAQCLPSLGMGLSERRRIGACLRGICLSWLASDDMFRWITVDRTSAQRALLLTLDRVLALADHRPDDDVDGRSAAGDVRDVLSALERAGVTPPKAIDGLREPLVRIHARLWRGLVRDEETETHKTPTRERHEDRAAVLQGLLRLAEAPHRSSSPVDARGESPSTTPQGQWDDWDDADDDDDANDDNADAGHDDHGAGGTARDIDAKGPRPDAPALARDAWGAAVDAVWRTEDREAFRRAVTSAHGPSAALLQLLDDKDKD